MHVLDYLATRQDVDQGRIGLTGISLGGMITWLAAAADPRIAAAAALIGVHGFK
jgi:dienelactone hydrolase